MSFAKSLSKNIGKNIIKNYSNNYSQRFLDDAEKPFSKKVIQKTAEVIGDLFGNKNRIRNFSRSSPQNTSKAITNEHDKEIPKKYIDISRRNTKTIDKLRLI